MNSVTKLIAESKITTLEVPLGASPKPTLASAPTAFRKGRDPATAFWNCMKFTALAVPPNQAAVLPLASLMTAIRGLVRVTPDSAVIAALDQVEPLEVSTFPAVPGATACSAPVPLPISTLFSGSVFDPVPPLATGRMPVTSTVRLTD